MPQNIIMDTTTIVIIIVVVSEDEDGLVDGLVDGLRFTVRDVPSDLLVDNDFEQLVDLLGVGLIDADGEYGELKYIITDPLFPLVVTLGQQYAPDPILVSIVVNGASAPLINSLIAELAKLLSALLIK